MNNHSRSVPSMGVEAMEVAKDILRTQEVNRVALMCHSASINWRQRFITTEQRLQNLDACLEYKNSKRALIELTVDEFNRLDTGDLNRMCQEELPDGVVSLVSRPDAKNPHIAMMNLHPSEGVMIDDVVKFIKKLWPNMEGYLLSSGRFYHFYGNALLDTSAWQEFIGNFLIAYDYVHPGYCGFRLIDGFSTLRLTSHPFYKPHVPKLVALV